MDDVLKVIKKKKKIYRMLLMLISLILNAFVYNMFLLPLNLVTGGTIGVATITKHLYQIEPATMLFLLSLATGILSLMYLGIEKEEMQKNDFLYAKPETEGLYTEYSKQARIFNTDRIFRSHEDKGVSHFNFAGYAKDFKLINEYNHTLLIIDKSNKKEIEDIFNELKYAASGRLIRRKLQKYTISIRHYEWEKLMEAGVIQTREGIECLANENYYNKETGICFEDISDYIF